MALVPQIETIEFYAGDTHVRVIEMLDLNDNPVDVSGKSFDCEIRSRLNDEATPTDTLIATFDWAFVTDGTDGKIELTLRAEESIALRGFRRAYWDLEMTTGTTVQTLFRGNINIVRDVSE